MPDRIELGSWEIPCVLGVLEREQRTVQRLEVELGLELDLEDAAEGDLGATVNYAAVRDQVAFLVQHGRFRLLESIAFGVARLLLAPPAPGEPRAQVGAVHVSLKKPDILDDATPGIRIHRVQTWCELETRMLQDKVWAEELARTPRTAAHRVTLQPKATWTLPTTVAVMVIAGRGTADGRPIGPGDALGPWEAVELIAGDGELTLLSVGVIAGK